MKIETLTKDKMNNLMIDLIRLEDNWTDLGEKAWEDKNFLLDLPMKWELSFLISEDNEIKGYIIGSFDKTARINKILVDKESRRKGFANILWEEFRKKCVSYNIDYIELKVLEENIPALNFYKKIGFVNNGYEKGADGKIRMKMKYLLKKIKHSTPSIDERDISAVSLAIRKGEIATGRIANIFENQFSKFIKRKYSFAVNNGSAALFLSLKAIGAENLEVIIPSYTCYSVLNSVVAAGAKPIIVDINSEDYNISLEDTKRKITEKTIAIITPHMFGKPVQNIHEFMNLGNVIEDCALSTGAIHNGERVGKFGLVSVFSFYATKMMTTGQGGMVLTDDENIKNKIIELMTYDNRDSIGEAYNFKMPDFNAALGLSQLSRLGNFIEKRKKIAGIYLDILKSESNFKLPDINENIFFRFVIKTDKKMEFAEKLNQLGIEVKAPVFLPLHRYFKFSDKDFPNSTEAFNKAVSLPIYPDLNYDDAYFIAESALKAVKK